MVAPTRTPQARGVKCDLCKKILALATWLDQTKLAKAVREAEIVLELIRQHDVTDCSCIPKNIQNLLVGSTHFEIHRLSAKQLDASVHKSQVLLFEEVHRQKLLKEQSKKRHEPINDCQDNYKNSRFKTYCDHKDEKNVRYSNESCRHLIEAIDSWKLAMEDPTSPFNSKLALRLGLTHHVIYACYFFKFFRILDYQLITANLLLNLFKSTEGVTTNAILHANFLLIKTLLDCNQIHLARQHLKQALKLSNYSDKTYYESILLTCVSAELALISGDDTFGALDELAKLAVIQKDDKLQHYYARTLALAVISRYIHCYPARSDQCFEFYHTFRYVCAIIRRCFESSFELVLSDKAPFEQRTQQSGTQNACPILDHNWIKFAICDFAFNTFCQLSKFFARSGQPESVELLYNGLNLVSYRTGCCFWQTKMTLIGADLDILCDKYDHCKTKLADVSQVISKMESTFIRDLIQLDLKLHELSMRFVQSKASINTKLVHELLQNLEDAQSSYATRLANIELFDCRQGSYSKLTLQTDCDCLASDYHLIDLRLRCFCTAVQLLSYYGDASGANDLISILRTHVNQKTLTFDGCQNVLETLLFTINVDKTEDTLLEAIASSNLFLETEDSLATIESTLSALSLNSETDNKVASRKRAAKGKSKTKSRLNLVRRSKRGTYDVASRSEESLFNGQKVRYFDTLEALENFQSLTREEILVCYLRNAEPNPDYLLYRRVHELMFAIRLKDERLNHEQLLYHFCEASSSNTLRYRWMMLDEQQLSPFEASSCPSEQNANHSTPMSKHLSFNNVLVNSDKSVGLFTKSMPSDYKIVQLKYLLDEKSRAEHLLIVSYDSDNDPLYIHAKKSITGEDFLEEKEAGYEKIATLSLPVKLWSKVEDAKKTLFFTNHQKRSEARHKLETEVELLLHSLENDWLGPFRFVLCGKTHDVQYSNLVDNLTSDLQKLMLPQTCNSRSTLVMLIENAALLNREEFCQVCAMLFNCHSRSNEVRDCFNKWTKSLETFISNHAPGLSKLGFLQALPRGQVGLIVDKQLEHIPFESLPTLRVIKQGIFRVPSLRLFYILTSRAKASLPVVVDPKHTSFILDPSSNLGKTRDRFESKLKAQKAWVGTVGQPPETHHLEDWLSKSQVYLFIGHGAGTAYYNKLCKKRGLTAMSSIRCVPIVMGCSSGRVLAEGPRLESFGINWVFILRGASAYVGLLWDVTDTDIDKFLDSLLSKWMHPMWSASSQKTTDQGDDNRDEGDNFGPEMEITEAIARSRQVCQFKFLVGATPVTYGLPIVCCRNV